MFLGYQNNKIGLVANTKEELEKAPCMVFDKIVETDKNYFLHNGEYVTEIPEPTIEEQVAKLEAETGLTRVMREMVLAENSGASDYVKAKANEIEDLAKQLRTTEETSEIETVDNTQNDEYNSFGDTKQ